MDVSGILEGLANCADPPIHHVARCDDVDPGRRLHQRLGAQPGDRLVVEYISAGVDQPILAVRGVRVERDVGEHAELRQARLQRPHRARYQALRIGGFPPVLALERGVDHRKQRQCRDS